MEKPLFEETQKNILLIIAPAFIALFFGMLAAIQIGTGKPIGNHPISNTAMIIIFITTVIIGFLLGSQKLRTTITPEEIVYSYGLFSRQSVIKVSDIKSISIREYNGLKEFLGWGVKYSSTTDCFTVSGDKGLEIVSINSNRKILIGTQRPADLQLVLQTYFQDKLPRVDQNKYSIN